GGILFALWRNACRDLREEVGAGHGHLIARGKVGFEGLLELHIVGGDALFEPVEFGVLVDLPPFAGKHAVGGVGRLPVAAGRVGRRDDVGCARFLVGGGRAVGGPVVVGAGGLAGGKKQGA